jgi:hypothetical protein
LCSRVLDVGGVLGGAAYRSVQAKELERLWAEEDQVRRGDGYDDDDDEEEDEDDEDEDGDGDDDDDDDDDGDDPDRSVEARGLERLWADEGIIMRSRRMW